MAVTTHLYSHLVPAAIAGRNVLYARELADDLLSMRDGERRYVEFTNCPNACASLENRASVILGILGENREKFWIYTEECRTLSFSSSAWWLIVERRVP